MSRMGEYVAELPDTTADDAECVYWHELLANDPGYEQWIDSLKTQGENYEVPCEVRC